jgi:shikimate kinase
MNRSILLIGHRTSGKTVLGRKLAKARGLAFLDLDEIIETREGRSAAELVSENEPRFRRLEQELLLELVADPRPAVLTTGAGCEAWPLGIRTIWIYREGWEESALSQRRRLRPELSADEEIAWMRRTREDRYRRAAHLCLHLERGCGEEESTRRLLLFADWLVDATGRPGLAKSWMVPRDLDDLPRAVADAALFGMAGVEIRSDVFADPPAIDVPVLASLRTEDPTFFRRAENAAAFDCDASLLRCLDLKGLEPRPLVLSSHPDDVFKDYFDFLTGLESWVEQALPDWKNDLHLKWAPRVKSWVELRYANQLYKVYEKTGGRLTFLAQGKNWKWMRVQRLFHGNDLNYISTGCLEHSQLPPTLDYFLPHVIGDHARDFYGIIGSPVEQSVGDVFHRALSLHAAGGAETYVKIPLKSAEIDNCLHLLPQISFKGLSVTSPLKKAVLESNFVGTESNLTAGNTLALIKGSFLLFDTDQVGMEAALTEIESDGVLPASVVIFGSGGVLPAITRALEGRGWGPIEIVRARDGWSGFPSPQVTLVVDASGGDGSQHASAPRCQAWLDLRYRDVPLPPTQAERFYNGMTFYRQQALAQRRVWGLPATDNHPLL